MERAKEDEDEPTFLPHEQKASCGPKKKTSEKSPPAFTRLSRTKISLACLSCNSDDSPACAKAYFLGPAKKRMGYCWFLKKGNGGLFFAVHIEDALPSTSHCTCRLNNVHTYQQCTHQQRICNLTVTCLTRAAFLPFTDPMLDVSCSCIMLCHPRRYRYAQMHSSEALVTMPCHMEERHMLVLPMQVNERL